MLSLYYNCYYYIILFYFILYYIYIYIYIILYYIILYYTILYYIILYYIILYDTILYYIILYKLCICLTTCRLQCACEWHSLCRILQPASKCAMDCTTMCNSADPSRRKNQLEPTSRNQPLTSGNLT